MFSKCCGLFFMFFSAFAFLFKKLAKTNLFLISVYFGNEYCKGVFHTIGHVLFVLEGLSGANCITSASSSDFTDRGSPQHDFSQSRGVEQGGGNSHLSPAECWAPRPSPGLYDPVRGQMLQIANRWRFEIAWPKWKENFPSRAICDLKLCSNRR